MFWDDSGKFTSLTATVATGRIRHEKFEDTKKGITYYTYVMPFIVSSNFSCLILPVATFAVRLVNLPEFP